MKDLHPYKKRYPKWYVGYRAVDYLMAMCAWAVFFAYRKIRETPQEWFDWSDVYIDSTLYLGVILIPLLWLALYTLFDQYEIIFRRSRVMTLFHTLIQSTVGCFVLLVAVLSNDQALEYSDYLNRFVVLLGLHFSMTAVGRWMYLTIMNHRVNDGLISFPTAIIGSAENVNLFKSELNEMPQLGFEIIDVKDYNEIPSLISNGGLTDLIYADNQIVMSDMMLRINDLFPFQNKVQLHCSAFTQGVPHYFYTEAIPFTGLVSLFPSRLKNWELVFKRFLDISLSVFSLIVLIPVVIWIVIKVKASSPGAILFKQDRVGHLGATFSILKFRSMYSDAEPDGPLLSHDADDRCTPFGAFMRKWRLDEIPQFWNVIKGDMSLVGPRPERQYYIDKLKKKVSRYDHLLTVRPGITSLGQVKYGYASDINQMLKRLKFDLIYVENQSLTLDFKILFYTLLVLLQGKGK